MRAERNRRILRPLPHCKSLCPLWKYCIKYLIKKKKKKNYHLSFVLTCSELNHPYRLYVDQVDTLSHIFSSLSNTAYNVRSTMSALACKPQGDVYKKKKKKLSKTCGRFIDDQQPNLLRAEKPECVTCRRPLTVLHKLRCLLLFEHGIQIWAVRELSGPSALARVLTQVVRVLFSNS